LGHHIHGHCYNEDLRSEPVQEFSDEDAQTEKGNLRQQAMELEADCYAARLQLKEILKPAMATGVVSTLKPQGIATEFFLLNFLFLAIASHMFLKLQSGADIARIRVRTHPPQLVRLNFIMREFQEWLAINRSDLAPWASVEHFQKMMKAIEACYGESDSPRFWREQGNFLMSEEGETYMENLARARAELSEEMKPYRWESFLIDADHQEE
jgi:hypothetical protein